jgi:hypothetical protein
MNELDSGLRRNDGGGNLACVALPHFVVPAQAGTQVVIRKTI